MGNTKTNRGKIMEPKMTAFEFAAEYERKAANKKFLKDFTEVALSIFTCGFSTVIIGIIKGI
tara:strand:- start:5251 stop:5436 length:186 start_codon:yes stop_codon:yes gene_type:complete